MTSRSTPVSCLVLAAAIAIAAPPIAIGQVSATAAIAMCFSPEDRCAALVAQSIDAAKQQILVGAYELTTGTGILEALVRAKQRGVDVELVADKTAPCERNDGVEPLAAVSVPIWIDYRARIAHAKTMVIDNLTTLAGSYNWTKAAASNSEDLNLIVSPDVAAAYVAHWRSRQSVSRPYRDRADWCS